jgi:hypothetical protein
MKAGYDWACTLWQAGLIDTFVIIAPNGVHRDWIEEGFKPSSSDDPYDQPLVPPEWHDQIDRAYYRGEKAGTKYHQKAMRELFYSKKFVILSMSYDSSKTDRNKASGWIGGHLFLKKMVKERRCALIMDESSFLQTPSALVTRKLVGIRTRAGSWSGVTKYAKYKRILEGTPVDEGVFNIYSQMQALDNDFWMDRGLANYQCFKTYFATFQRIVTNRIIQKGRNKGKRAEFDQLVAYQNLDELKKILKNHSSRVLKKDALDLPEKIYQHLRFEMSPEQWRMYEQLKEELYLIVKKDGGDLESLLTAELPIVNVLKLYQITCGYIPFPEEDEFGNTETVIQSFKENPRLENALQYLNSRSGKTLIWCRFRRDIDLLCDSLGDKAVRYDGTLSADEKDKNKKEWLKGDAQFLIPQIQAMARGHTLNITEDVLYYSNDSRLRLRRQSEDRTHRGIMDFSVRYMDMLASDTVDELRVKALRKKLNIAQTILGDDE